MRLNFNYFPKMAGSSPGQDTQLFRDQNKVSKQINTIDEQLENVYLFYFFIWPSLIIFCILFCYDWSYLKNRFAPKNQSLSNFVLFAIFLIFFFILFQAVLERLITSPRHFSKENFTSKPLKQMILSSFVSLLLVGSSGYFYIHFCVSDVELAHWIGFYHQFPEQIKNYFAFPAVFLSIKVMRHLFWFNRADFRKRLQS